MRIAIAKRSESLTGGREKADEFNGDQQSELQVSKRPQFRASNIMTHALALYNLETTLLYGNAGTSAKAAR